MLEDKVLKTIQDNSLINNGEKIVVGVSGGPDSICLINILDEIRKKGEIKFDLVVCHVNHMIRKEASSDEKFVKEYCKNHEIPFFSKRAKVEKIAKENKKGTEETGREIRYAFFNEIKEKVNADKIATAHTKNDNAETVLMNIIRGSSTSGLKGIVPIRDEIYIKPLIEITRDEIEKYCIENGLNPRHDKTNDENIYTRNKVRNILIPLLQKEFNPNIIETIDRLSKLSKEENDCIEGIAEEHFARCLIQENEEEIILDLKMFNCEENIIKGKIILDTIKKLLGTTSGISKVHIDDIIKMCEKNIGNKYLTPNKNIKILVNKGKMYFIVTQNSQTN